MARSITVHPRWRGEHMKKEGHRPECYGSSPLARGTPCHDCGAPLVSRFIPAGAGNTTASANAELLESVHPRWRGEHDFHQVCMTRDGRFIPAGAGNTHPAPRSTAEPAVHPRWRGEHSNASSICPAILGSSPLARGTLHRPHTRQQPERFIPAGAGNTRTDHGLPRRWPVHPRWRGEHLHRYS